MARKDVLHEDEAAPPAARPGGLSWPFLSFPIRELHVNLFLMGNYLLFGLFMCLGSFFGGWVGGEVRVRRVDVGKGKFKMFLAVYEGYIRKFKKLFQRVFLAYIFH